MSVFTVLVWLTLYVDLSTYQSAGREIDPNQLPVGIWDWLIGHECKGVSETQSRLHQLVGMSLIGLIYTVPTGCWVYCYGYGWEFLFSGCVIGVIYEIGFRFPVKSVEGLDYGSEVAEAIWGAWLWMVMFVSILGREKDHFAPEIPFIKKKKYIFRNIVGTIRYSLYWVCHWVFLNGKRATFDLQTEYDEYHCGHFWVIVDSDWFCNSIFMEIQKKKQNRKTDFKTP